MIYKKNNQIDLVYISRIWQMQLNLEYRNPEKNVRLSFKDIGSFGEFLALDFFEGFKGSGSGGMGLDLMNFKTRKAIEVKTCCTIQNSRCSKCNMKFNSLFLNLCPKCGSDKFREMNDSRFGINAEELLNQYSKSIIENLTLCHISMESFNLINKVAKIKLEWFIIDFNNEEIKETQLLYFKNQKNKGRKPHANLLPNSYDFFKLCPFKFLETIITIDFDNINIEPIIENLQSNMYPRVPEKIFKNNELSNFRQLKSYSKKTKDADSVDFTKTFEYREKSLGKNRGDTRSNAYKKLM
jgi:hypothetical protein